MPNKDDNKWSNEGQKGGKNQKQDWYIWQIEAFCLKEVFADSRSGSQLDVLHSVLEVKLASKLSGLTPYLSLKET